ncbi:glyoxylase-like metal-dependent hydrolase (beta-lactamase superfamily II) [Deinococcus sp. HSC-46F16]|uniref:MBL fold metallo-hydrolase n=1 Tax=Deinococcus sp. HSC-46F16 TaxID=2910968 RepID=UPI0020A128B1|nr:MBL fold metallo-hydrolase [Deinococcus sp. HSC-46F16]MCP2013827.1 glyoxylase-like metal-dependent hydrolase (beta-lactamase superfamily II) [Deinococcus sp. HSC-46F16]
MSDSSSKSDAPARPLNRRDTLRLLGAAGLVTAAAPLVQAQTAPAQPQTTQAPAGPLNGNGFYRQRIGDMTATVVSDGTAPLAAVLPTWGANPDRQAEFAATLAEYSVPATNTVNHFNPVVLEVGGRRVLIDTGRGGTGGQLVANLGRAGLDPASIDTVFITHGHGDHIGGLTTNGQPTFPGARHVMGAAEFQFWTTQANPNAAVQANLIGLRDRFTLIQPGAEIVPGVTAVATPGHTLGHLSVRAGSGNAGLMVFGDAAGHFLLSLRHRGAYIGFDTDGPLAARTRQRIFNEAVEEGLWVTGYHFPFHAIGHLRRQGLRLLGSYEYEPAVWQWS